MYVSSHPPMLNSPKVSGVLGSDLTVLVVRMLAEASSSLAGSWRGRNVGDFAEAAAKADVVIGCSCGSGLP